MKLWILWHLFSALYRYEENLNKLRVNFNEKKGQWILSFWRWAHVAICHIFCFFLFSKISLSTLIDLVLIYTFLVIAGRNSLNWSTRPTQSHGRPVGIIVFTHVRTHFSNLEKQATRNNVRYWLDNGSGRVDHWWHLSCKLCFQKAAKSFDSKRNPRLLQDFKPLNKRWRFVWSFQCE